MWHASWVLLTSAFFSTEISTFCYIKKNGYILHFNTQFLFLLTFFWLFKGCFNKNGCNCDDVSKVGDFGLSYNKDFLK